MRSVKIVFIVLFAAAVLAPGVLMFLAPRAAGDLGGFTKRNQAVPLTVRSFREGTFQRQYETRFARSLPVFATLVRADNQLSLSLFKQISSNPKSKVIMGNDGHLIERSYLAAFNRQGVPKKSKLRKVVADLRRLTDLLAERGKPLILLISTNKPGFYPHLVPSWYRVAGAETRASGYELFMQLLSESGVDYIDSRTLLQDQEAKLHIPMFAPTGTHWNEPAICRVTTELSARLSRKLPHPIPEMRCDIRGTLDRPTDQDLDLLRITNLLLPERLVRPAPRVKSSLVPNTETRPKPRLLIVGTSFCWGILQMFNRTPIFSEREFLFYFQRQLLSRRGVQRRIDKDTFDITAAIERSDAVLIEVNEAFVHRAGYGFIERAIGKLKSGSRVKPDAENDPLRSLDVTEHQ